MELTSKYLADSLGGTLEGDPDVSVNSVARIENGRAGAISFLANPKYEHFIYTCKSSVFLVNKTFVPKEPLKAKAVIRVDDSYKAIADVLGMIEAFRKRHKSANGWCRLHPFSSKIGKGTHVGRMTFIGKRVTIGANCDIYPQVYLGDGVTVGDGTIIYPGVRIYHDCKVGSNCILHSNAVLGADGFGFAPLSDGSYEKIPQTGNVVIEDNVEIGANTTIDRSTMGSTVIHGGVKIDNLCQIAHNVEVGKNTVMAAMTGIAGSTHIGEHCMFGGQSGIVGHISVASGTTLCAASAITGNVKKEGEILMGYPAIDHFTYLRAYARYKANGEKR
ncbi:MAG: UDP-3-O-(3-hydroxymyristoyl)glucosamine N-acyltransferase [Bacteroidales bacterium]|jgi:UDP-3-O-[3-hydroxymyristoyl] glucosamine N-acyltransferase|nr:UDP-3-O-(3-hydroxymyristoyl)glucosamine N-acyltransferase [Bacteroidales bacterium]MCI2121353.1 UDP-3-O-(3-hydroxymyristoyl)glucosamine N-acyltransferase [Bacteroidales bacterium]MCI2145246.1 UDP-3-O-(3-hydroxymyristoyl)glucosamine N-acyltransferase [Bacteroidales bacterium]